MILQLENSLSRASELTRDSIESVVNGARNGTESVANRVTRRKKSVHQLSEFGLKLTKVGHQTADKLLKQQARLVEGQLDMIANRLKAAAKANNLPGLIRSQLPLLPEGGSRIISETRATVSVFVDAGSEVRGLVKATVAELKGEKPAKTARRKKATVKKATAKKAAAKPKAKAKTASKTATKKRAVSKKKLTAGQSATAKTPVAA